MSFTAVALVLGVMLGFAAGGRVANVKRRGLELVTLLVASVLLQAAAELLDVGDRAGLAMVLVSYVGLAAFALANIKLVGMPIVMVGLLCNLAVITANSGMPVRDDAIVAADAAERDELATLDFGAKRHLESDDDVLAVLGDIIPVRPTQEVVSFGDLILAVGVADVIFRLLKPAEVRARRHDDDDVIEIDGGAVVRRTGRLVDA